MIWCEMCIRDSYTIVIVTHNMQQAVRISDRTAFFLLGELVELSLIHISLKNVKFL